MSPAITTTSVLAVSSWNSSSTATRFDSDAVDAFLAEADDLLSNALQNGNNKMASMVVENIASTFNTLVSY